MARWHERHCRNPQVVLIDGIPFCNNCFALATSDELCSLPSDARGTTATSLSDSKPSQSDDHTFWPPSGRLTWPAQVHYRHHELPTTHSKDEQEKPSAPLARPVEGQKAAVAAQHMPGYHHYPLLNDAATMSRLLKLDGGDFGSPLHGELEVIQLLQIGQAGITVANTPPSYEYLSYSPGTAIAVPSEGEGKYPRPAAATLYLGKFWDPFIIEPSTSSALQHLRPRDSGNQRTLWVASICVDGTNLPERSAQMGLLGTILAGALRVVAYVGEPSETSGAALAWLDDRFHGCVSNSTTKNGTRKRKHGQDDCGGPREAEPRAVRDFFARPYFHSVRTFPEFIVPSSVLIQCGPSTAPWPLDAIDSEAHGDVPEWLSLRQRRGHIHDDDLLELLSRASRSLHCSDPRDKVFSLFAVVSHWKQKPLVPSYDRSVEEVYTGTAAYLAQHCHSLVKIVLQASTLGSASKGLLLPTWVPDWGDLAPDTHRGVVNGIISGTPRDEPAMKPAEWIFPGATEPDSFEIHNCGGLELPVLFLRSIPEQRSQSHSSSAGPALTIESTWSGNKFGITWAAVHQDSSLHQQGDSLVWLAGQFTIVRPRTGFSGQYHLVRALGGSVVVRIPVSIATPEIGLDLDEVEEDEAFERLAGSMYNRDTGPVDTDGGGNWHPQATRRLVPLPQESRLRILQLDSELLNDHHGSTPAIFVPEEVSNADKRFRRARDRVLSIALCSRTGLVADERAAWQKYTRMCDAFRVHDGLGAQFLLSTEMDIVAVGSSEITIATLSTIAQWVRDWSLGRNLEKLGLDVVGASSFAPLLATLIQWVIAAENVLRHLSESSQNLESIWGAPFPGASFPGKWLGAWQEQISDFTNSTASPPGLRPSDLLLCLKFVTKLAKISISRLPDRDGTGLAELDLALRERASIFDRVASMEWAKHAFWAASVSHLSEFDQDMVTRMELHTWGLELDHEEVIMLI